MKNIMINLSITSKTIRINTVGRCNLSIRRDKRQRIFRWPYVFFDVDWRFITAMYKLSLLIWICLMRFQNCFGVMTPVSMNSSCILRCTEKRALHLMQTLSMSEHYYSSAVGCNPHLMTLFILFIIWHRALACNQFSLTASSRIPSSWCLCWDRKSTSYLL